MAVKIIKQAGNIGNLIASACFWCAEPKSQIASGDHHNSQIPAKIDYEPCTQCHEKMRSGILLIEVEATNPTRPRPEIEPGIAPSGRWLVVQEDDVRQLFPQLIARTIVEARRAFVENVLFEQALPEEQRAERKEAQND